MLAPGAFDLEEVHEDHAVEDQHQRHEQEVPERPLAEHRAQQPDAEEDPHERHDHGQQGDGVGEHVAPGGGREPGPHGDVDAVQQGQQQPTGHPEREPAGVGGPGERQDRQPDRHEGDEVERRLRAAQPVLQRRSGEVVGLLLIHPGQSHRAPGTVGGTPGSGPGWIEGSVVGPTGARAVRPVRPPWRLPRANGAGRPCRWRPGRWTPRAPCAGGSCSRRGGRAGRR